MSGLVDEALAIADKSAGGIVAKPWALQTLATEVRRLRQENEALVLTASSVKLPSVRVERLISAAQEIERLSQCQEARSTRLQKIASEVRQLSSVPDPDNRKIRSLQSEARMMSCTVTDFGDAINDLRRALNDRPRRK